MEVEVYLRAQEVQQVNRQLLAANEELVRREQERTQLYEQLKTLEVCRAPMAWAAPSPSSYEKDERPIGEHQNLLTVNP